MQRIAIQPRSNWQAAVEAVGLTFHESAEGAELWNESAYFRFTRAEIEEIAVATETLYPMCLEAVDHVIRNNLFARYGIEPRFGEWIAKSWHRGDRSLYGRFDLAYDGINPPKLLEFNADTPTMLIESAVSQWYWLKDRFPELDQFNSIHEQLVAEWKGIRAKSSDPVAFAAMEDFPEDFMTVTYLRDTAEQAGLSTQFIEISRVGFNSSFWGGARFVDEAERPISRCFKLYPWEWMMAEEFGRHLPEAPTEWFEPPWKVLLSGKAILPILWELFPDCPHILPASFDELRGDAVRKPIFSREGSNITMMSDGRVECSTEGPYTGPYVHQERARLRAFDGRYPIIGSWVVGNVACGMGIREDESPIITNVSPFVPHVFTC